MIGVTHQISRAERRVGRRTLEAGEARTVVVSRTYETSLEDLWDACTTADRIARWFLPVSGELREGGRYAFAGNASGTIERCAPPHAVDATWEHGGQTSWVELRLTAESADRTGDEGLPDRGEIEAWATSDEGRRFYEASSERWGEASIAAGTPEADARAAAARTTAVYTGRPA